MAISETVFDNTEMMQCLRRGYDSNSLTGAPHANTPLGRAWRVGVYCKTNSMPKPHDLRADQNMHLWADGNRQITITTGGTVTYDV